MSQKKSGHVADNSDKQNKEDSLIPNGELKWRKEEEELQDTDMNLKQNTKDEAKEEKQEKSTDQKQTELDKSNSKTAAKEEKTASESKDQDQTETKQKVKDQESDEKQKDKPSSEKESAASVEAKKEEYSIEDTLGPIDFKEYSVDLQKEEKEKKETKSPDQSTFVFKKTKKEKTKRKPVTREKVKTPQVKIPKWKFTLRVMWLPISLIVALFIGLIVGNTVIGEQPVSEAFNIENWFHLYKLIFTK